MTDVVIASNEADATAAAAVEQHHAQLAGALALRVAALSTAAAGGDADSAQAARANLAAWCAAELLPHALAEESSLYPAAHRKAEGRLLVDGMLAEHKVITSLVQELDTAADPVRHAATATALQVVFDSHLAKENDLVLPLLVGAPDVSVVDLLDGMHEILGAAAPAHGDREGSRGDPGCDCGDAAGADYPELDARAVPHDIRHATIFGALDSVRPGAGMDLIAPHDPLPLLAQLESRSPGKFSVDYLERGPQAWRLRFLRAVT